MVYYLIIGLVFLNFSPSSDSKESEAQGTIPAHHGRGRAIEPGPSAGGPITHLDPVRGSSNKSEPTSTLFAYQLRCGTITHTTCKVQTYLWLTCSTFFLFFCGRRV